MISIIMPTYNRANLLSRAIESVRSQSLQDWELIVIDDASTDDTRDVLADWQIKEPRLKVFHHQKNYYPDISRTLNEGIDRSLGEYVARLDDDDWWIHPDKLKMQVEFLQSHPDCAVCGGGMIVVDPSGRELFRYLKPESDEEIRKGALFANPFSHTTVMFPKSTAKKVGGYGDWRYAEDWDFWLKLGKFGKLYNFQEYFTAYVMSGGNKSFVHQRPQAKMILKIIEAHRYEYPDFNRAYFLNFMQYLYSFLPLFVRKFLHPLLSYLKRSRLGAFYK